MTTTVHGKSSKHAFIVYEREAGTVSSGSSRLWHENHEHAPAYLYLPNGKF